MGLRLLWAILGVERSGWDGERMNSWGRNGRL